MWWFSFQIPNYAGTGKAEAFRGEMGYQNRATARKHALEAVHAELARHCEAIGDWDLPGQLQVGVFKLSSYQQSGQTSLPPTSFCQQQPVTGCQNAGYAAGLKAIKAL
jgi:hypothetical protein